NATRSYLLCRDAISELGKICGPFAGKELFRYRPSFQFASYKKDREKRKKAGIKVQFLDEKSVEEKFGFCKPAGLLSSDGAEADAYMITHNLLRKGSRSGAQIFDHTEIISIRYNKRGVELLTAFGKKIRARKLIIACGY